MLSCLCYFKNPRVLHLMSLCFWGQRQTSVCWVTRVRLCNSPSFEVETRMQSVRTIHFKDTNSYEAKQVDLNHNRTIYSVTHTGFFLCVTYVCILHFAVCYYHICLLPELQILPGQALSVALFIDPCIYTPRICEPSSGSPSGVDRLVNK